MANPPVNAQDNPSVIERFRRELRNPSMVTVILIVVGVLAIPLGILGPSWVSTTKGSLQDRNDAKARTEAALLSSTVLIPSQITPWMLDQIERMEAAESPADWNFTSFTAGPCDATNLSQLPAGPYADAIAASCVDLNRIQVEFASDCRAVQSCNLSSSTKERLASVREDLIEAFSDAGFVLPYRDVEEPVGP